MKKLIPALIVAACASVLLLAASPPAGAHTFWSIGTAFSVGGLHFDLVFGPGVAAPSYGADFYFRTRHHLPVRGYVCHGGCFRERGYTYHHPACSVVGHYFGAYRFSPRLFVGHVPHPYRYRYERYYRYPSYDRYRYDRHRTDDRYRSRHDHDRYDRYRRDGRHDGRYRSDRFRDDSHDRYDRGDERHRSRRYAVPRRGQGGREGHRGGHRDDD
jgi:hypothetical protein